MTLSQRLRTCAKHTGLDAVIELLQEAADEIDALQARAQVQGEREAFEAFAQNCPMGKYSSVRRGDGYDSSHTQLMWDAWQARAILAPRPERVPMTDEQRNDLICTVTTLCAKLSRRDIVGMAIDWTESHHSITTQEGTNGEIN